MDSGGERIMNKTFHQTAPLIALALMPESFKAFLISEGFTEEDLKTDSDLPDMVDHDNITINAEIHHAHSYKLELREDGKLHWADGDALERLKGLCADVHDFHAEGRQDMVRYCIGKMTHYKVDSITYPHNHRGKPWSSYHEKFETELGHFIAKHKDEIGEITFEPYKDVYKDSRKLSLEMWPKGRDAVAKYESGEGLTDDEKLEICRICVKAIGDVWTTLANELKL
jgi:hypothetical protein